MKRKPLSDQRGGLTVTMAPHTKTKIDRLSARTQLSRGRLIDLAIDGIEACSTCLGCGRVAGPNGPDTEACPVCDGQRVTRS